MARRPRDLADDPAVVPAGEPPAGDVDAWLAGLGRREPTKLPKGAAELVIEARSESE